MAVKHIILGAGGSIGNVLVEELKARGQDARLVSRAGQSFPGMESARADLTTFQDTRDVIEDSSTVYLLAGLPYSAKAWREKWPVVMRNVVEACKARNARLIFFDNVYMYGKVDGAMTEDSPIKPVSRKGEIRAQIDDYLLAEARSGNILAIIARAADLYGPYTEHNSVSFVLAIKRLAQGSPAQWLVNARTKHSLTYSGDCGRALYLLATAEDAPNQVWHMPTARPPLTGEQFVEIAARKLGVSPKLMVMKKWMLGLAGIFDSVIRESYEMLYQNEFDYIFDSTKFEQRFNFTPTPYEQGIEETIEHFKRRGLI